MSEAARKLQLADELDVEGRHEAAFLMRTFRASGRKRDDLLMAFCAENHGASGAGSQGAFRPQVSDSTAPIAVKCQSFLENVIAQFGRVRAWDDRGSRPEEFQSGPATGSKTIIKVPSGFEREQLIARHTGGTIREGAKL